MTDATLEDLPADAVQPSSARYATFTSRFRAVIFDSAIVCAGIVLIAIAADATDRIPGSGRVAWLLMFAAVFLYEPIFIWRRGATIGHARNHLVVVSQRSGGTPTLGQAFARYVLKVVLGLPSFVTMVFSRKHQAIHDWLSGTTVQLAANADAAIHEFHIERTEDDARILPSRRRRVIVLVGYLIALFLLYGMVFGALDPTGCARQQICSDGRRLVLRGISLSWITLSLAAVVAAWKGLLLGARGVGAKGERQIITAVLDDR